jgi:hypothetical protein
MANLTPPQSPFLGADGRPAREWQHWMQAIITQTVAQEVAQAMALFPDPGAALAALQDRVNSMELQQAMRSDAAEPARRPMNG